MAEWLRVIGDSPRWRRPQFGGGLFTVTVFGRFFYWRYGRG